MTIISCFSKSETYVHFSAFDQHLWFHVGKEDVTCQLNYNKLIALRVSICVPSFGELLYITQELQAMTIFCSHLLCKLALKLNSVGKEIGCYGILHEKPLMYAADISIQS